ncbi:hypothetical protein Tco_0014980 [Tanacetum coccineum]
MRSSYVGDKNDTWRDILCFARYRNDGSAIRQLAYGYAPDVLDEYLQIGANNDLNALYRSNLFDDVLDDVVPECPFTVLEIDGMWSRYGVRTLEFRGYSSGGDMVIENVKPIPIRAVFNLSSSIEKCPPVSTCSTSTNIDSSMVNTKEALVVYSELVKAITWMAFGGNTCDLGSFGEEMNEITDLHQNSPRSIVLRAWRRRHRHKATSS